MLPHLLDKWILQDFELSEMIVSLLWTVAFLLLMYGTLVLHLLLDDIIYMRHRMAACKCSSVQSTWPFMFLKWDYDYDIVLMQRHPISAFFYLFERHIRKWYNINCTVKKNCMYSGSHESPTYDVHVQDIMSAKATRVVSQALLFSDVYTRLLVQTGFGHRDQLWWHRRSSNGRDRGRPRRIPPLSERSASEVSWVRNSRTNQSIFKEGPNTWWYLKKTKTDCWPSEWPW